VIALMKQTITYQAGMDCCGGTGTRPSSMGNVIATLTTRPMLPSTTPCVTSARPAIQAVTYPHDQVHETVAEHQEQDAGALRPALGELTMEQRHQQSVGADRQDEDQHEPRDDGDDTPHHEHLPVTDAAGPQRGPLRGGW
jgi:hypothetical protein